MPPRGGHSGGSHFSHSGSSGMGSFRGPSMSRGPRSSGPSRHSGSSFGSGPSRTVRPGNIRQAAGPAPRPRINQPVGYPTAAGMRPRTYFGRAHTYVFYPIGWTDPTSGRQYEQGYYDENGERYENVSFAEKDGSYKNVLCECEYCGTRVVSDMQPGETLTCKACGGSMKIVGAVDEAVSEAVDGSEAAETVQQGGTYSGFDVQQGRPNALAGKLIGWIMLAFAAFFVLSFLDWGDDFFDDDSHYSYTYTQEAPNYVTSQEPAASNTGYATNTELFGTTIRLAQTGDGTYAISDSGTAKTLVWQEEYDSYFDAASECYVWYNNEVEPNVWQYWFEGISSDYGSYGWMEYGNGTWYIEESYGNWIELPARYDRAALWHIE